MRGAGQQRSRLHASSRAVSSRDLPYLNVQGSSCDTSRCQQGLGAAANNSWAQITRRDPGVASGRISVRVARCLLERVKQTLAAQLDTHQPPGIHPRRFPPARQRHVHYPLLPDAIGRTAASDQAVARQARDRADSATSPPSPKGRSSTPARLSAL